MLTECHSVIAQAKQTRAQFSNWLCYEASAACAAKPPPLPAGRAPGPAFEVMDRQEAELEKMLAGMKVGRKAFCVMTEPPLLCLLCRVAPQEATPRRPAGEYQAMSMCPLHHQLHCVALHAAVCALYIHVLCHFLLCRLTWCAWDAYRQGGCCMAEQRLGGAQA